jgi:UDP-N-acetylmuramate dehydrogenase
MKIIEGKPLADFTTFRIGGKAKFFCAIEDKEDLKVAVSFAQEKRLPIFILGGGSNIIVSDKGFDGLVIKIDIKGIEEKESKGKGFLGLGTGMLLSTLPGKEAHFPRGKRSESSTDSPAVMSAGQVFILVGAGENWDDLVAWTVDKGYCGLENLSLIPGTVGAAPVQNIGAYGVEVGNLIESVEVFDVKENTFKNLVRDECGFSYRDSLFKHEKGRYVITSVLFKLKKNAKPDISYKDLKEFFGNKFQDPSSKIQIEPKLQFGSVNTGYPSEALPGKEVHFPSGKWSKMKSQRYHATIFKPSIVEVRAAIIAIRTAKLPDFSKVGTAGSFFKNPIISKEKYAELKEKYPELPNFPESAKGGDGRIKIPLAWIIDKVCGLKGKSWGKAGIHDTQALVIVNHGGATYEDIEKVAHEVEKSVKEKTRIEIEREVIMV